MNTPPLAARVIAAIAAVVVTLSLLYAVYEIAEPQRSILIAKLEHAEPPATTTNVAVAMAAHPAERIAK